MAFLFNRSPSGRAAAPRTGAEAARAAGIKLTPPVLRAMRDEALALNEKKRESGVGDSNPDPRALQLHVDMMEELDRVKSHRLALAKQRDGLDLMRETYKRQGDDLSVNKIIAQVAELDKDIGAMDSLEAEIVSCVKALGGTGQILRARAKYAFAGTPGDGAQLPFTAKEELRILMADNDEWWLARNVAGRQGFVPRKFLEVLAEVPSAAILRKDSASGVSPDNNSNSDSSRRLPDAGGTSAARGEPKQLAPPAQPSQPAQPGGVTISKRASMTLRSAVAMFDFGAGSAAELSLKAGQEVIIISMDDPQWWEGYVAGTDATNPNNTGFFPKAYVKLIAEGSNAKPRPHHLREEPVGSPAMPRSRRPESTITDPEGLRASLTKAMEQQPHKRCRVLFDYEARGVGELTIRAGQQVVVTNTDDDEWWEGLSLDGRDPPGFFPRLYVEVIEDVAARPNPKSAPVKLIRKENSSDNAAAAALAKKESGEQVDAVSGGKKYLLAIFDYQARSENELSLKKGDMLVLLNDDDDDWWAGESTISKKSGFFPKAYVKSISSSQRSLPTLRDGTLAAPREETSDKPTIAKSTTRPAQPQPQLEAQDTSVAPQPEPEAKVKTSAAVASTSLNSTAAARSAADSTASAAHIAALRAVAAKTTAQLTAYEGQSASVKQVLNATQDLLHDVAAAAEVDSALARDSQLARSGALKILEAGVERSVADALKAASSKIMSGLQAELSAVRLADVHAESALQAQVGALSSKVSSLQDALANQAEQHSLLVKMLMEQLAAEKAERERLEKEVESFYSRN